MLSVLWSYRCASCRISDLHSQSTQSLARFTQPVWSRWIVKPGQYHRDLAVIKQHAAFVQDVISLAAGLTRIPNVEDVYIKNCSGYSNRRDTGVSLHRPVFEAARDWRKIEKLELVDSRGDIFIERQEQTPLAMTASSVWMPWRRIGDNHQYHQQLPTSIVEASPGIPKKLANDERKQLDSRMPV